MWSEQLFLFLGVLVGILASFLFMFVAAPIRLKLESWLPADSSFTPVDEKQLPPEAHRIVADLMEMGFTFRGTWQAAASSHATGRVALLEHPRRLDFAYLSITDVRGRVSVDLQFLTRFEDGTEIATLNNRVILGFPQPEGRTMAWLPELRDAESLFRVHEQIRDALGGTNKRLAIAGDPAAFLQLGIERNYAHFVSTGYYALDEADEVYRPTWKGAILISWRNLWPLKPLFYASRRQATRRFLQQLGVSLQ